MTARDTDHDPRPPAARHEPQGHQRPVVEERGRLLPRRRDLLDSDGDGCGDLPGLTDRIDYLAGIGVSCLWLMPFYPSPNRDDGYDITDFYARRPARSARSATSRSSCAPRATAASA